MFWPLQTLGHICSDRASALLTNHKILACTHNRREGTLRLTAHWLRLKFSRWRALQLLTIGHTGTGCCNCTAFDRDGERLVNPECLMIGPARGYIVIAFSPDGNHIVSGSGMSSHGEDTDNNGLLSTTDGFLTKWNTKNGAVVSPARLRSRFVGVR